MSELGQLATSVLGLAFVLLTFKFLRKGSLSPAYCFLWLLVSAFIFSIALPAGFFRYVSVEVLGLTGGDHLVYAGLITFLMVYCFYLTTRVCEMSARIQRLISNVAILEHELKSKQDPQ